MLIVITGLDQLPPAERWPRLIGPLAEALASSGLGELPDLASLRHESDHRSSVEATEVAVSLVNLGYGLPLITRVVEAAGIKRGKPVFPARWQEFECGDYFTSALADQGHWDEHGQYWYILPADRIYEDTDRQFLVIGGPGVDGIDWGYRRLESGVWAHPIDGEFVWRAPTAQTLLEGYLSGAISM